ncbi:hypothetical protein Taro_056353 [Colocasia esculenta]|uniref:Uncharacterized protein n=1 Tax=Colocasia esculenta TaxID=4460 RepID=A0A843XTA6_COLES|nr:hypothetical protein [Colocasia esculenta]
MASNNPTPQEVHNQQLLEREIRSMISTLTGHLTNLGGQAVAGAGGEEEGDGAGGMRIVTLAGTNKGAMMEGRDMGDSHGVIYGDDGQLSAFANSNYQAVNNSIMLGGSCAAADPGVHLQVITEYVDDDGADQENPLKHDSDHVERKKSGREEETVK